MIEYPPPNTVSAISDEEFRLNFENADLRRLLAEAGLQSTEQDIAAKLQKLLMGELYHRIQNMLALTQAIASQSINSAGTLEEARAAISHRLAALGRAHSLLLETSWGPTSLLAIVNSAVQPFDSEKRGRFVIQCSNVLVSALAVQPLGMLLNELATNATKYGALSNLAGQVSIVAEVADPAQSVNLVWKEHGGPAVRVPDRKSFGSKLIEQSLLGGIDGRAKLSFDPSGLACQMTIPIISTTV